MKRLLAVLSFIAILPGFLLLLVANWAAESLPDDLEGRE